jgi:hypothetical protein
LVSDIKGRTLNEGAGEQDAEGNIFTEKCEVAGEWRKLHNEEPRDLYSSQSIIRIIRLRRIRWAGHVARIGERNVCRLPVGKRKVKGPLGRPRIG